MNLPHYSFNLAITSRIHDYLRIFRTVCANYMQTKVGACINSSFNVLQPLLKSRTRCKSVYSFEMHSAYKDLREGLNLRMSWMADVGPEVHLDYKLETNAVYASFPTRKSQRLAKSTFNIRSLTLCIIVTMLKSALFQKSFIINIILTSKSLYFFLK